MLLSLQVLTELIYFLLELSHTAVALLLSFATGRGNDTASSGFRAPSAWFARVVLVLHNCVRYIEPIMGRHATYTIAPDLESTTSLACARPLRIVCCIGTPASIINSYTHLSHASLLTLTASIAHLAESSGERLRDHIVVLAKGDVVHVQALKIVGDAEEVRKQEVVDSKAAVRVRCLKAEEVGVADQSG